MEQFDLDFDLAPERRVFTVGELNAAVRALKAGGRFVGELGGHGCVGAITVALLATLHHRGILDAASWIPCYFPTADEYEVRLRRAGFVPQSVQLIPRPAPLPTGMRGWLETFANPYCAALPPGDRDAFLEEAATLLKPVLSADYTRLRFAAVKGTAASCFGR